MNIQSTCKFCHKPIMLIFDDSYNLVEDALGLKRFIPFGSCNRCADYRVARRPIWEMFQRACFRLQWNKDPKIAADTREMLVKLCQRYMRLIAEFKRMPVPDWDEGIIEGLMAHPDKFSVVLKDISKMFSQQALL